MVASRVGRLFVVEMNLRVLREKFDSHAKPHARTIKSGWRTVARAVASRYNAMNLRTRFETQTPGLSETNKSTCKSVYRRMTPTDIISLIVIMVPREFDCSTRWISLDDALLYMMHFNILIHKLFNECIFKMASYVVYYFFYQIYICNKYLAAATLHF